MFVFLRTGKLDPGNHSPWKAVRLVFLTGFNIYINQCLLKTESSSGMIPRAVDQVFRVAEEMKAKGWEYKMEGQFLEIVKKEFQSLYISTDCSFLLVQRND